VELEQTQLAAEGSMLREAQALARLSHPNVVAIYDVGMLGDHVWIAMEFVAGLTGETPLHDPAQPAWDPATSRRWAML
jgi:serine/threonine protein kinase